MSPTSAADACPRLWRPLSRFALLLLAFAACCAAATAPARAGTTLPSGFTETLVAGGLDNPTAMAFAPDGRLFVCQQGGKVRVVKNGALLATPFVSLTVSVLGERGLVGIAFDPDFAANGYVYLYYAVKTASPFNRVSRFTANGDVAVAGSEKVLLNLPPLTAGVHNGGAMHFGADGKLYVATGDNNTPSNAQALSSPMGKLLRINADGSIPADNPFYNTSGAHKAVWARGLRNPYTLAVHRVSGRLFVNDVGQDAWEEIDEGAAGANYGWPTTEGPTTDARFKSPLFAYGHGNGGATTGCAITGGVFYDPAAPAFPAEYVDKYFFTDFCSGWIRVLDPATGAATGFATGTVSPIDLRVGPDGALYYISRDGGYGVSGTANSAVFKIAYGGGSQAPVLVQHPADATVGVGQAATFAVSASGSSPLSYQWQRDGVNIAGANASSYTTPPTALADSGQRFRCVVSNAAGSVTSNSALLTVSNNQAPAAAVTGPAEGATYAAGDVVAYAGTGTDPEDGDLPAGAFTWRVDLHHDTHSHPFLAAFSGVKNGTFTIPRTGETSANVWYRIHLTVKDSGGLTHTTFRDVRPRTSTITLATSPAGLQVTLDGQPKPGPHSVVGVVGMEREIGVVSPQTLNGVAYEFASWSDGGTATHTIRTPAAGATYTATFRVRGTQPGDGEVIVDNGQAMRTGAWSVSAFLSGRYGSDYLHDGNTGKGAKSVRFTPRLPSAGTYEVYVRYPNNPNGAANVPVRVRHAGGVAPVTIPSQKTGGGAWVRLGTWSFHHGTRGFVMVLNAGTTGYVIADAVKFVRRGRPSQIRPILAPWGGGPGARATRTAPPPTRPSRRAASRRAAPAP